MVEAFFMSYVTIRPCACKRQVCGTKTLAKPRMSKSFYYYRKRENLGVIFGLLQSVTKKMSARANLYFSLLQADLFSFIRDTMIAKLTM